MTNVSRTNQNKLRPLSDLYSTPHEATVAFMAAERRSLLRAAGRWSHRPAWRVWEPAAGEGYIADCFLEAGFEVIECDKTFARTRRDHCGRDLAHIEDFFDRRELRAPVIVTNPPYSEGNSGDRFVRHALSLRPRYAAFFLPITFFASLGRADILDSLFCGLRLARVLVPAWRLTLKPPRVKLKNSGVVTYGWFVWERARVWSPAVWRRLYRVQ